MLLFEAKAQIDSRLTDAMRADYQKHIPEYFEALEIASKCIEAQGRLADMLNDFVADFRPEDSYSATLVLELLNEIRFDWKIDE